MKKLVLSLSVLMFALSVAAQDDLMKELEQSQQSDTDYAFQTFKGTRLVNGHTVETKPKSTLEFIFAHRFGPINGGAYEMFGLDQAYVRYGLDYGITDNLSVSIGRNSVDKTSDGYFKYKVMRQSKGSRNMPFTMVLLGGAAYQFSPKKNAAPDGFENIDRLSYVGQLLIARKITPGLSLQLMPTLVHRNAVTQLIEKNDQLALGVGGRIKVTKSVAFTSEYYYRLDVPENSPYNNTFGIGVDIETGGHVFQLVFTNTRGLTERAFITQTDGDFADGDIHFGFNVTRTFQFGQKK
ncbi:hypothetical protein KK083_08445 [Fulvivirgaceae bacterium PWU4]|uniref:DUF5777 domain-containing protein n=1 Tax=Chryseosolibacter histidini TaxID=2782349 RepID=A0AAP2DK97_9BACT|nr:DUF5777 family beta-barrel protein [Chryseosolibacter histidini]MBT1696898.1 hypothetical protein [Chryseosolibacter histidini]